MNRPKQRQRPFEGCKVYLGHPSRDNPGAERSFQDWVGKLCNVRFENGALRGDLRLRRQGQHTGEILEAAESFSDKHSVGLSINARGHVVHKGGRQVVESIERVRSVDLVMSPATNRNLFESWRPTFVASPLDVRRTLRGENTSASQLLEGQTPYLPFSWQRIGLKADNPTSDVRRTLLSKGSNAESLPYPSRNAAGDAVDDDNDDDDNSGDGEDNNAYTKTNLRKLLKQLRQAVDAVASAVTTLKQKPADVQESVAPSLPRKAVRSMIRRR